MTFGVLFYTIDTTIQYEIWRGIVDYAEEHDIHLISYVMASKLAHTGGISYHFDTCFDAICNNKSLDGVIFFSGFFDHQAKVKKTFLEYVSKIPRDIPCVSISNIIPGFPAVMSDNIGGIYGAVDHLIRVHGKRKIAFITGPDDNREAEERFIGYKKALADNGIPFDDRYVVKGDFTPDGGHRAALELLDERKLPMDAVAASDDDSAISMMNLLRNRNILVPAEVAVTGFDDDKSSATFVPTISTVKQDFHKIGQACTRVLHKKTQGEPVEDISYIPSVFVCRQSCGCLVEESEHRDINPDADDLASFLMQWLVPLLGSEANEQDAREWVTAMTDRIKESVFDRKAFLNILDKALIHYGHQSGNYELWHEVLDVFMVGAQHYSQEVSCVPTVISTLVHAAPLINKISINEEHAQKNKRNEVRLALRQVASSLVLIFDIDTFADELYRLLPEFSIDIALVGLYKEPIPFGTENANRTIDTLIGFDGDNRFNLKQNSWNPIRFSDYSAIDGFDFNRKLRKLLFFPLFFMDEELGAILLPYDPEISTEAYETLRVNIATALKGAELLTKIQTLSITDELTGLLNRRGFFQYVYARMEMIRRNSELMPVVMFMDMDGLKFINDNYGHKEGDKAIAAFAHILKETLRKEDIIARMGGDEFIVFSSVKTKEATEHVESRLRAKLIEYNDTQPHPYTLSCSIGSVVLEEATKECFETAILNADSVLYEEKMEKKKKGQSR
ncbi:MAG: GGDEF domain-containing protein [Defluviitaleaceae bacterium]|nr:GGDEF domain-containing protein [Defluviitaleaceae bacterium]